MTRARPDIRLDRILTALGIEVAEATDEEVLAAAAELGMKPMMKGTAAFFGLKQLFMPYEPERLGEPDAEWNAGEWESETPSASPWKRGPTD
jgi:hypothetical protein